MAAKILLAEDDGNLRDTLAETLRAEGYEVNAVPNGQAAMDALDQPDAAQVIILDCLLPKVQGFDVAKFVRGRGLDTPIIFISGVFKSPDQQKDARDNYGAKAYLTKPFDAQRLIDAVRPLIFAGAPPADQQPLPAEGSLVENPALYLLWRAAREMHTGVLELFGDTPGERARVFVYKGRAVLAQHSDPQINVGVELVRAGVIDADSYRQAVELAVQRSIGLYDVLKGEGWMSDHDAKSAYKALIPRVLEKVVAFNGRFRWVATDGFTNLVPSAACPIIEPLLAGLRRTGERELDAHVSPRRPLRLAPGDAWSEVAPRLIEGCGSDSLTRAINGRATIAMMLEAAGNPSERAARFRQIYLLMSTMAVRASLEVIPMATAASTGNTGSQAPVSLDPAPARPARPRAPASQTHPPPSTPRTAPGMRGAGRPVIDESADQGAAFSPEENEARGRIAAKFEDLEGKDYFTMLGINRGADVGAVKKAYFALAKEFHTDAFAGLNLGTAQKKLDHIFQTIQTAYATLSDEKKRGEYEAKMQFDEQGASSDLELIFQAENDMNRARQLVDRGELAGALSLLDKVVPVMPKNDEVLGYQKYCHWFLHSKAAGAGQLIIRELEGHYKAQPGALALKEFQGWIALEIGDNRTANIAFKKVLEIDPRHMGATKGMRALQRKIEADKKPTGFGKFLKR